MVEKSKILKVLPSVEVKSLSVIQTGPADEDEWNDCVSLPHGNSLDSPTRDEEEDINPQMPNSQVSRNERSSTGDNKASWLHISLKDVSIASNVSEQDIVKNNEEYFERQNARKASGNTSLIREGHGGAKNEESGINESHASASPIVGAIAFVDADGNGDGKAKANLGSVKIPGTKRNKAANGNGAGGESINGNTEGGLFSSSPDGTGGGNVHNASQTELSRLDQNDEKCSDGEKATSRNKDGDRCDDNAGSHSNQVQSLTSVNIGVPERREPADNTGLKSMGSKVYGESVQWTDLSEGASGHGGDTSEEGSTDGWGDGNSEDAKDLGARETEKHGIGSKSQAHDGTETTSLNQGGDGDLCNLDDSLSTSEEDSYKQDNSMSAEKDETLALGDKAKKNEHRDIQRKGIRVPSLKGIGKGNNGRKRNGMAGNHGVTDGELSDKRRTVLPDDRKDIGGLTNMNISQDANKHRDKPRDDAEDSSGISSDDESNNSYSFSDEFMQGDDPNDSHDSEGSENGGKDEEEGTSEDESDEQSVNNDGDSGSDPHSSETEDVSQSASSESKPGSGGTKSDSSSESEGKPASSESQSDNSDSKPYSSKSDSSSESQSESSEGKSGSSSASQSDSSSESSSEGSESKSESSEGKSDSSSESKSESSGSKSESSSEGKSDSSSESKSESSESKSDSSSEGKSDSSSESKSDSSSESKSDSSSESKSESSESKSDSSSEGKSDSSRQGKSDSSSESKSESSESKSDSSSEGKSDSSSESKSDSSSESKSEGSESKSESSEGKSESSEGKSDSSSESKSESSENKSESSEGKSGSSSESKSSDESERNESSSQGASSEKASQSSTDNDASDASKSNESESQSASHSDSGSDESDIDGSHLADTTENASDSESAESKESDGDSPLGSVDSESESVSEGSESNDSTSDY